MFGKYEGVQMKADMTCLVDGLVMKLEERLGDNGRDGITRAMHFLSLRTDRGCRYRITVFKPY